MHLSSAPFLLLLFYKSKNYFKYLFLALILFIPILFIVVLPIIDSIEELQQSLNKVDAYTEGGSEVGVFHKIYFCFITLLFIFSWLNIKKKLFHPIIITTFIIYYISFFINPVIGFRFSPYIILVLLLNNFEGKYNFPALTKVLNLIIILLLPYFIFTFIEVIKSFHFVVSFISVPLSESRPSLLLQYRASLYLIGLCLAIAESLFACVI